MSLFMFFLFFDISSTLDLQSLLCNFGKAKDNLLGEDYFNDKIDSIEESKAEIEDLHITITDKVY